MSGLSDELFEKKIVEFTDQELLEAGFTGDAAPESVRSTILIIKQEPKRLGFITGFEVDCMMKSASKDVSEAPLSPTLSDSSTLFSQVSVSSNSALTAVNGEYVSEFEKHSYYIGVCASDDDVPLLYYRTDLKSAPFTMPPPGAKWFTVPHKTAHGPFDEVLTASLWTTTVAPKIISEVLDAGGIKYQSLRALRFSTPDNAGKQTLGPIVIWIGTHHGTCSPDKAHNISPAILKLLEKNGVTGSQVEWYESRIERLNAPHHSERRSS